MILPSMFLELKVTKRVLFFKFSITISAAAQAEWAHDLVDHNGIPEEDAIMVINRVMTEVKKRLEKI